MAIRKVASGKIDPDLKDLLNAIVEDITDLRAKLVSTQTKLDADATVTDTNYAALGAPATQQLVK